MSLIILEGSRQSGKTFFAASQSWIPVFKFDFNNLYNDLKLPANGEKTHHIGLGKELMIHQLNKEGFIDQIIMDRGIITNSVWGVLNNRVSYEYAIKELNYICEQDLFKKTQIIYIDGTSNIGRKKDVWDYMDERIPEEKELFKKFINYLMDKNIKIQIIENKFDSESLSSFQTIIKNLK